MITNSIRMRTFIIIVLIIVLGILLYFRYGKYRCGNVTYAVFYIPYGIHTENPVSFEDIEERSVFLFEISSPRIDALFGEVEAIARSKEKANLIRQLDYVNIRAKIIRLADRKSIYLSSDVPPETIDCNKKVYEIDKNIISRAVEIIVWQKEKAGPRYNDWELWEVFKGRKKMFWD